MARIYKETHDKGLNVLSVDEGADAKAAADLWAEKAEPWPNFHDSNGDVQRTFPPGGIPELVLIDSSGKITYAESGLDEPALRAAIAKLGPEFAPIAPTPQASNPKP